MTSIFNIKQYGVGDEHEYISHYDFHIKKEKGLQLLQNNEVLTIKWMNGSGEFDKFLASFDLEDDWNSYRNEHSDEDEDTSRYCFLMDDFYEEMLLWIFNCDAIERIDIDNSGKILSYSNIASM